MEWSQFNDSIRTTLGEPVVSVALEDAAIEKFITTSTNLVIAKVLRTEIYLVKALSFQKLNVEELRLVLDVQPYNGSFMASEVERINKQGSIALSDLIAQRKYNADSQAQAMDYYKMDALNLFFLSMFGAAGTGFQYHGDLLNNMLMQQLVGPLQTISGHKFDWTFDHASGGLYLANIPEGTSVVSVRVKQLYTKETLPFELRQWVYDTTLAQCKITEGRIRSKFSVEGHVGPNDGESLITEGKEELNALKEKLESFVVPNWGVKQ